jgi:hypothetical protein
MYFRELIRYIHLNPLRAKIVSDIKELNKYPYSGHSALMGKKNMNGTIQNMFFHILAKRFQNQERVIFHKLFFSEPLTG